MANRCEVCGKGSQSGQRVKRRGKAKREGGAGRKITGRSNNVQKANIQKIKGMYRGKRRKISVCTSCLKSGRVVRVH